MRVRAWIITLINILVVIILRLNLIPRLVLRKLVRFVLIFVVSSPLGLLLIIMIIWMTTASSDLSATPSKIMLITIIVAPSPSRVIPGIILWALGLRWWRRPVLICYTNVVIMIICCIAAPSVLWGTWVRAAVITHFIIYKGFSYLLR